MKTRSKTQIASTLITSCGKEFAQILAQWTWDIRLELGQQLSPTELRTTEFAHARDTDQPATNVPAPEVAPTPPGVYGPPQWARPSSPHGFPGSTFTPQPDGTLRCPANHPLYPKARRPEQNDSLRVLYAVRIGHCCSCPLRSQCQESLSTLKLRRVSAVPRPLDAPHSDSSPPAETISAPRASALARLAAL
ncbi:hypothetical protein EPA93_15695 [Ktedonosporobacter rubrisoli]|uniref:Transposase DDE domain-containing protein n=1 Tax=Ktedonosporobacter rubrisoli TaxID=2509675 RepID=A0A4P6JPP0_KTERU|nr:hypothetical protein [Ktedonosporobacter rubrisoli]QBD77358.1 hypothetical protein EPA93_15695 [Ktedonosporobacter rubrisoli]